MCGAFAWWTIELALTFDVGDARGQGGKVRVNSLERRLDELRHAFAGGREPDELALRHVRELATGAREPGKRQAALQVLLERVKSAKRKLRVVHGSV